LWSGSIRAIARRTGYARKTVQRAVRSDAPPRYVRAPRGSKLDPFKDEIERLLRADPRLPGTRVRELLSELGYRGGKTILDDYLREVRPRYLPRPRTFQRTVYRPGGILQVDLFALGRPVPVGHGQTRKGFAVLTTLGSRGRWRARWCSRRSRRMCCGRSAAGSGAWAGCPSCSCQTARGRCTPAAGAPPRPMRASSAWWRWGT
jgi:hypothetical protein